MKNINCENCLIKSSAAKTLSKKEFEIIENNSAQATFKKGDIIFKQDALSLNVAYLKSGIVKIHKRGPVKEKILRIVGAPTYLNIESVINDEINQFSATAISDATVCFVGSTWFKNFIFTNGKFAYEIIGGLCKEDMYYFQKSINIAQKQVPGLIAETLLCFSDSIYKKNEFSLPLTRGEIGDIIGATRESVSRILNELCNEKVIAINNNNITILNKEMLSQISKKG